MAAIFAAYRQVADSYGAYFGLDQFGQYGLRFAAHVSYYAPCIARFDNTAATGAPVLMMWGDNDDTVDPERCREIAADLRNGGSPVETVEFAGAHHQWDGGPADDPVSVERGLSDCSFRVDDKGRVTGKVPGMPLSLPMTNSYTRKAILLLCSDRNGYVVGEIPEVRARSNEAVGRFLLAAFRPGAAMSAK
jgi:hypothetical protein